MLEPKYRVVNVINETFENKKYCSAVFLDISQAYDKVWHPGLLYILESKLPHPFNVLLKSYLENRCFQVKHNEEITDLSPINSGTPEGNLSGSLALLTVHCRHPSHIKDSHCHICRWYYYPSFRQISKYSLSTFTRQLKSHAALPYQVPYKS